MEIPSFDISVETLNNFNVYTFTARQDVFLPVHIPALLNIVLGRGDGDGNEKTVIRIKLADEPWFTIKGLKSSCIRFKGFLEGEDPDADDDEDDDDKLLPLYRFAQVQLSVK